MRNLDSITPYLFSITNTSTSSATRGDHTSKGALFHRNPLLITLGLSALAFWSSTSSTSNVLWDIAATMYQALGLSHSEQAQMLWTRGNISRHCFAAIVERARWKSWRPCSVVVVNRERVGVCTWSENSAVLHPNHLFSRLINACVENKRKRPHI